MSWVVLQGRLRRISHTFSGQQVIPRPCLPESGFPWEIRAVHEYGLGQKGIRWLLQQKAVAAEIALPVPLKEHIIEIILKKAVALKLFVCGDRATQAEQFVHHRKKCHVIKNFVPPYGLVTVEGILHELRQPKEMALCKEGACSNVSGPKNHCWGFFLGPRKLQILVGRVMVDKTRGILKLHCNESVDVIFLNSEQHLLPKVGSTVGIYDFYLVEEEFIVQHEVFKKCYIICNPSTVISIAKDRDNTTMHPSSCEFEILCKGPLVSLHKKDGSDFKRLLFFNLKVNFTKLPKGVQKPMTDIVKVLQSNIDLFPIITSGDTLQVHSSVKAITTTLSHNLFCCWAREPCCEFDDSVCLQKAPIKGPDKLEYMNLKSSASFLRERYCIYGVVSKHFEKPIFESEYNPVPIEDFDHNKIAEYNPVPIEDFDQFEILCKGPLVSLHKKDGSDFKRLLFFNLKVNFTKLPKGVQKPMTDIVKVLQSNIDLFPIITSGDTLQVHSSVKAITTTLSHNPFCCWAREPCCEFDDSVCLQKAPIKGPDKLEYMNLKSSASFLRERYCIYGVVSKHFEKPIFESEYNPVPIEDFDHKIAEYNPVPIEDFDHNKIGTPQGKKMYLVLKDKCLGDSKCLLDPQLSRFCQQLLYVGTARGGGTDFPS